MITCQNCGRSFAGELCPSCGWQAPVVETPSAPVEETPAVVPVVVEEPAPLIAPEPVAEEVSPPSLEETAPPPVVAESAPVVAEEQTPVEEPPAAVVATPETPPSPTPATPKPSPFVMPPIPEMPPSTGQGRQRAVTVGTLIVLLVAIIGALGLAGRNGAGPLGGALGPTATAVPPTATSVPTATATPVPTIPPAQAGFTQFKAADGSYGLNYPTPWATVTQTAQGATIQQFISPDTLDDFGVTMIPFAVPPAQYPALEQQLATGIGATNAQFAAAVPTQIGNTSWSKISSTYTLADKVTGAQVPYTATILISPHGGSTYALLYAAPTKSFAAIESASFNVMAQSFTFLK